MLHVRLTCLLALVVVSAVLTSITAGLTLFLVTNESSRPGSLIVVDSDGGVDDTMAILMLSKADKIRIAAITIVSGITGVQNATRNIHALLDMIQLNSVTVYPGEERYKANITEGYFGWDGFGDFLPPARDLEGNITSAADMLIKIVDQNPGKVTLLCLGPLSNLADALSIQPDLLNRLRQVIIVGSSYKGGGNVGPKMEFNIATDPEAASRVFHTETITRPMLVLPVEMIEADASFPTVWREERLGAMDTEIMHFFNKAENKSLYKDKVWACYDQTGAAVLVSPGMIKDKISGSIRVDADGSTTFSAKGNTVDVVTGFNTHRLQRLLIETLIY